MKDPTLAFDHFSRILARATSPYAKARAGVLGRAARRKQRRNPSLAAKWYAAGAEHMATFYGQLAAHQLGNDAPPHPVPEPVPDAAERARFDASELVRADRIFFALGDRQHSKVFLLHLADTANTADRVRDARRPGREQRAHRSGDRGGQARDRRRNCR